MKRFRQLLRLPQRVGIFTRLLSAFLIVALLPLAVYWQLEHSRTLERGQESAENRLRQFSEGVARQVDDWTALNLSVMKAAAALPAMESMQAAAQRRVMTAIAPQLPWAYLLHTTGLDGTNIARSDDGPPSNYRDRAYYSDILAGRPHAAEVQIGRTSKRPAFLVAVPILRDGGALGGMLIQAATLDEVTKSVTSSHLGRTGYAFLMTAEGRLIASAREPSLLELKDYSAHPAFLAARAGGEGLQHYRVDGRARIADIRRTKLGWIAVTQQDSAEAFEDVRAAGRHALLLLLVTAASVTLLSLLVARSFARPIEEVTGIARRISQGQLDFNITTRRRDQIGDLLRAMQAVRATLQRFVDGQRQLALAHRLGDLDHRIEPNTFTGVYREMAVGVNDLVAEQIEVTMRLRDVIDRYAVGDFSVTLPPQPGKKRLLNETTDKARQNLIAMQQQIVALVEAAARGDFSVRGDEAAFQNVFRDMVRHLNHLMQTADSGLSELARVQAAVAQGDLTVMMTGEYEGTFADLQRDTNATVIALAALIREIERSRELLRATLEHLPQGVSVVDTQLALIAWNRRYAEIFDYPPELLRVGQPIEALLSHNATRGLLGAGNPETEVRRRLQHLRSGARHARQRQMPDGTVLETRGNPLPGIGYVTSYSDVTAYKQTETALRALTDTLERRVAERTRALETAKAEAERANRYKTRFVSAAVHDLLQPLNAARMFIASLRQRVADTDGAELAAHTDKALAAQDEILSSLLDISRLESGAIDVRIRDFPLAPLLATLGYEFGTLAAARGLGFRWRSSNAIVRSDEMLLRRILQNFLSNAVHYTPQGRLLLGCRRAGTMLRIEVWDTGSGIPESKHAVIFEEFRRLDAGRDVQERGAGLGLAIVDRIAKRLGHRIAVRSWLGRGSVFSVTLPLGDVAAVAPATSAELMPVTANEDNDALFAGRNIWCIDDDPQTRTAMAAVLSRWQCRVQLVGSVGEARARAASLPAPDLLVLDYHLGDSTGPALLPSLLALWAVPVPVILATGERDDAALRTMARQAGWGFLAKPIRPSALRALMSRLLERKAALTLP